MAMTPVVSKMNQTCRGIVGNKIWCFGVLAFTAGDVYAAGGLVAPASNYLLQIRKLFGVNQIDFLIFPVTSSDGDATAGNTGQAKANFAWGTTASTSAAGTLKLFAVGRDNNSALGATETELAVAAPIAAMRFPFLAICSGVGGPSITQ